MFTPILEQLSSDSGRIPLAAEKLQFQGISWKTTDNRAKPRERGNLSFPHEEVSRLQHTLASTVQCPENIQNLGVNVELYGLVTVQFSNVARWG